MHKLCVAPPDSLADFVDENHILLWVCSGRLGGLARSDSSGEEAWRYERLLPGNLVLAEESGVQ